MIEILNYIDRLKKSGLSKHNCLEFLRCFLELRQAESPYMWFCDNDGDCDNCKDRCSIWQKGHNTPKTKCEDDEPIKATCGNCIHGENITYCKRWKVPNNADEDACMEHEVKE